MIPGNTRPLLLDEHRYIAHPHMAVLANGTWLLVANRGPRRDVTMHPPQDPEFTNILIRSDDEGATWSPPVVVPGYGYTGTECAGLTALPDGGVLLNQWRFRWYPWTASPSLETEPLLKEPAALVRGLAGSSELESGAVALQAPERVMPWARGGGSLSTYRSSDSGDHFDTGIVVNTGAYSGGYGMRGAAVLPDGDIVLPLSDVPHYGRIFTVRSCDAGQSWGPPSPVAADPACEYEEPAPIVLPGGDIVLLLRENRSCSLHVTRSGDGGRLWSAPRPTGINCYPAHLLAFPDGRLVAVTGRRKPPFGIVAYVSNDGGETWDIEHPCIVRSDLPNKDLGYPTAAVCSDSNLFVAYYYRDERGITGIHATRVTL